uniref:Uncharacterized protein n=1 Tax=Ditylenchus dipsaci TaxID=166011 RepID=A0A915EJW6_9BILA
MVLYRESTRVPCLFSDVVPPSVQHPIYFSCSAPSNSLSRCFSFSMTTRRMSKNYQSQESHPILCNHPKLEHSYNRQRNSVSLTEDLEQMFMASGLASSIRLTDNASNLADSAAKACPSMLFRKGAIVPPLLLSHSTKLW